MASHVALARKWRSKSFADFIGQEHVVSYLKHCILNNKIHHAHLFSGTRGIGKTSLARILAKNICCTNKIDGFACGTCDICKAIETGKFIDVIEVDAASRTKVEDTREILENLNYLPTESKHKIYIIDEVHMLSKHSFNALLKSIEEPPSYIKFIFATTEPEKIPETIRSRCITLKLKPIEKSSISNRLAHICKQENINIAPLAIDLIATKANGSLRDALSLLEQCSGFNNEQADSAAVLDLPKVLTMLGEVNETKVIALLEHIINKNTIKALTLIDDFAKDGFDSKALINKVLYFLHEIIVAKATQQNTFAHQKLADLAAKLDENFVHRIYQVALYGSQDLSITYDQVAGLKVLCIRMAEFSPVSDSLFKPSAKVENTIKPQIEKQQKPPAQIKTNQNIKADDKISQTENLTEKWYSIYKQLGLSGLANLVASNLKLVQINNNLWHFVIKNDMVNLVSDSIKSQLKNKLIQLDDNPKLEIEIAGVDTTNITPDKLFKKEQSDKHAAFKADLLAKDPAAAKLIQQLNADIEIEE